jgi:hypothetical protein
MDFALDSHVTNTVTIASYRLVSMTWLPEEKQAVIILQPLDAAGQPVGPTTDIRMAGEQADSLGAFPTEPGETLSQALGRAVVTIIQQTTGRSATTTE